MSIFNKKSKNNKEGFEEEVLDIARVTRVVAGGKRLSFRAVVVIGNKTKHQVGVGVDKGKDVAQAIQKASNKARKSIISVPLINDTIPHEVTAKYKASKIIIKPAKEGKGIIAGGSARTVFKLANIPNIIAKNIGHSTNAINNARVTILALSKLRDLSDKGQNKNQKNIENKIKK